MVGLTACRMKNRLCQHRDRFHHPELFWRTKNPNRRFGAILDRFLIKVCPALDFSEVTEGEQSEIGCDSGIRVTESRNIGGGSEAVMLQPACFM